MIPFPNWFVCPSRYNPFGFAQWHWLCHQPDGYRLAQFAVKYGSLSWSLVVNFMLLMPDALVKQSSTRQREIRWSFYHCIFYEQIYKCIKSHYMYIYFDICNNCWVKLFPIYFQNDIDIYDFLTIHLTHSEKYHNFCFWNFKGRAYLLHHSYTLIKKEES